MPSSPSSFLPRRRPRRAPLLFGPGTASPKIIEWTLAGTPRRLPADAGPTAPLENLESNVRNHIATALLQSGWVIDGPHGAAKILGLPRSTRHRFPKPQPFRL